MAANRIDPPLPPHFTAIAPLGRGNAAVVWRATYRVTGQEVAVKVWYRPLSGQAERERFINECHWHALLSDHPNIVGWVWASSPDEPNPWIATVPHGVSLTTWRRGNVRPSVEVALGIGMDLLAGLAEIHRMSLVHRDVNPNNILVDQSGRAALCDLGIAMSVTRLTREYAAGTPGYVAPELEAGTDAPSFTSDVYSAATVISELLGDDIPWQIDHLINTVAGSHRPSDRPADAGDFRQRLRRAMHEAGIELGPKLTVIQSRERGFGVRRLHRRASAVAGALLLAVGGAFGLAQLNRGSGPGALMSPAQTPMAGVSSQTDGNPTVSGSAPSAPGPTGDTATAVAESATPEGPSSISSVGSPQAGPQEVAGPPLTDGAVLAVHNADTGQCIDVPGFASGSVDGPIQQHGCHTGTDDNQRWRALRVGSHTETSASGTASFPRFLIQNVTDRLCLDVAGYGPVPDGSRVNQYHCRRTDDNQLFYVKRVLGGHHLVNEVSGLCLAVPDASTREDTPLILSECDGRLGQTWGFRAP